MTHRHSHQAHRQSAIAMPFTVLLRMNSNELQLNSISQFTWELNGRIDYEQ